MRRVQLILRLVAINRWNSHSRLNRGLAIISEAHLRRMRRPVT